jgi:hypothetical protein
MCGMHRLCTDWHYITFSILILFLLYVWNKQETYDLLDVEQVIVKVSFGVGGGRIEQVM